MFQRAGKAFIPHLRNVHTSASESPLWLGRRRGAALTAGAGAILGGTALWYSSRPVHNDATLPASAKELKTRGGAAALGKAKQDTDTLSSLVWGSNSNRELAPDRPETEVIRTPAVASWLDNVALRDLQLHETHAACVEARGDVYQWGDGFFGKTEASSQTPKLTLRGKNIVQLQLTDEKLYALSSSGKVYTLATNDAKQELPTGAPTPASDSWWGTGWLWGEDETVNFAEVTPADKLAWGESFVSIAAGKHHLLALTSKGRVFGHPVNKQANHYGQLGFRNFGIPDPASESKTSTSLDVELIPRSLADPYLKASRAIRVASSSATSYTSQNLSDVDDNDIKFCTNLFEIPVLRGVEAAQIATGSRTSFIRTGNGRVLAWGANDYGQLGLGSNVTLDTIIVPTEVILWRFVPGNTESRCVDVKAGGNLTAFVVERKAVTEPTTVDVLMAGNGQYGGLGNNSYANSQGTPTRVKGISGRLQYNDKARALEPIVPEEISISPTGHVLLALNSSAESGGFGGKDVMVWGKNYESELGNGKKSSLALPVTLEVSEGERLMLQTKKAKEVKDLHGKVWKRGVQVSQRVVAGPQSSAIYWKIE